MAFTATPTTWLPSWSEDGTNITLPIASLPELTDVEADGATGDIRSIVHAICEKLSAVHLALASDDKPANMSISRSSVLLSDDNIRRTYTFQFTLEPTGVEVKDEPA